MARTLELKIDSILIGGGGGPADPSFEGAVLTYSVFVWPVFPLWAGWVVGSNERDSDA